jgi:hypothetical protein
LSLVILLDCQLTNHHNCQNKEGLVFVRAAGWLAGETNPFFPSPSSSSCMLRPRPSFDQAQFPHFNKAVIYAFYAHRVWRGKVLPGPFSEQKPPPPPPEVTFFIVLSSTFYACMVWLWGWWLVVVF